MSSWWCCAVVSVLVGSPSTNAGAEGSAGGGGAVLSSAWEGAVPQSRTDVPGGLTPRIPDCGVITANDDAIDVLSA
jgi:hypothetical protein